MDAFSSLKHFGDNFGNADVVRRVSFFLNQRDKIAMATSTKGVSQALVRYLPTSSSYVTTVKPHLVSAFTVDNGVYSAPIETFKLNRYGCFGNFYESMITHVGANEDKDFYSAWYEHHLSLARRSTRSRRGVIDLYVWDLPAKDETFLTERLRQSVDTTLCDHHCLQYTREMVDAIVSNTSIVNVLAYSQISSCRCVLFGALARRSTKITSLNLCGGICHDTTLVIGDECVQALAHFSFTTGESDRFIDGGSVDYICESIADAGILKSLEVGNVEGDYDEWAAGLICVMESCPLRSVTIDETDFVPHCLPGMVRVLPSLTATDVKITGCSFGDWGKPVFDALFSNDTLTALDMCFTEVGDGSIGALVKMIKRGTLVKLAIGGCGISAKGIKSVLKATAHDSSDLKYLSVFDNQFGKFVQLDKTSLVGLHVGVVCDEAVLGSVIQFVVENNLDVDMRDSDECFNEGGRWWPWGTRRL